VKKDTIWVIAAGAVVGILAVVLTKLGNPANMGFCIACFERDIAGALGFFNWNIPAAVQYIRPEILGIVFGGFLTAVATREFKPRAGSMPVVRFMLGVFMMIGALAFLGCPLRMVIRLGGGDLNAVVALVGFIAGIGIGVVFLRQGFNLGRTQKTGFWDGFVLPGFMVVLLLLLLFQVKFTETGPLFFSAKGHPGVDGSAVGIYAGIAISLAAGLLVGWVAQRSRMCFAGAFRDLFIMRSGHLMIAVATVFVVILVLNIILGNFHMSFADQPVAHTGYIGNFLGMALVGICAVLLGGCPLRQLILAGNGNADSAITVFGMLAGAGFAHNLGLASLVNTNAWGFAAVILGLAVAIVVAFVNRK